MVFGARSKIEINGLKREIYGHSSNRFHSKVRVYSFTDRVRVDLQTYKVPEEQTTACLSLIFRDAHRVAVPEVTFHNVQSLAQEIVAITGVALTEKHSDTSYSLFGRH